MADPPNRDRRWTWVMLGIGFNTVTSLLAIGLWLFAPPGAPSRPHAPSPRSTEITAADPPRPGPSSPLSPQPLRSPDRRTGSDDGAPPRAAVLLSPLRPSGAAPASVTALADRLQLNPRVLSEGLGDARGELPEAVAKRLESAHEAGESMARRLSLDDDHAHTLVTLVTSHVYRVLVEERRAAPSAADPARITPITDDTLESVRTACGDDAASLVETELPDL